MGGLTLSGACGGRLVPAHSAAVVVESSRFTAYDRDVVDGSDERTRRYVERLDARRRTLREEIEDDVAPVRGLTLEQRGAWVASACRSAWDILRARQDAMHAIDQDEPPAPDFPAKWAALMAEYRKGRSSSR